MHKKETDSKNCLAKRLVSAARAIIAGQVGFSVGCLRLNILLIRFNNFERLSYPIFSDYYKITAALPIGTPRLQWERKSLAKKDKVLEKINRKYKEKIFDACFDIIDKFGE